MKTRKCGNEMNHTPTPWNVGLKDINQLIRVHGPDGPKETIARVSLPDDAAFIVRAVNCHEELVRMVKALTEPYVDECEISLVQKISKLVAKAEGK